MHLALVIEGDEADVGVWEGARALLDLPQHLARVGASKERQLPPVRPQHIPRLIESFSSTSKGHQHMLCIRELYGGTNMHPAQSFHYPSHNHRFDHHIADVHGPVT